MTICCADISVKRSRMPPILSLFRSEFPGPRLPPAAGESDNSALHLDFDIGCVDIVIERQSLVDFLVFRPAAAVRVACIRIGSKARAVISSKHDQQSR